MADDTSPSDGLLRELAEAPALDPWIRPIAVGQRLGRYQLLARIGEGTFGVVFRGQDMELGRSVAVKVLRERWRADQGFHASFRQEAIATARVNHENIVALYDYGNDEGVPYLVFELIDGVSLGQWLATERRSPDEILRVFRAAAGGLAAAHRSGLVHGDFKPENTLVGRDGRVHVADFGLARATAAEEGSPEATAAAGWSTRAGTPRYMAPEQRRGEPPTARSDQFSFSVALYEALFREHPFDADGGARPVPRAPGPARVRVAVARGLAPLPADRHASMDAFFAALRPSRRRLQMAVAALAFVTLAGAGIAGRLTRSTASPCALDAQRFAGIWDGAAREEVRRRFLAAGPRGERAFAGFAASVDDTTARLTATSRAACEATRVRGELSEQVLDLRGACIGRHTNELRALVRLVQEDTELDPGKALLVARSLPPAVDCDDVAALQLPVAPPRGRAARDQAAAIERGLAEVAIRDRMGHARAALAQAEILCAWARTVPHPPLLAMALYRLGMERGANDDLSGSEALLYQAFTAAIEGGDQATLAKIAGYLGYLVGKKRGRHEEGRRWEEIALAAVRRLGGDDDIERRIRVYSGVLATAEGRKEDAMAEYARALLLLQRIYGPGASTLSGDVFNNMAGIERSRGRSAEAAELYRRALQSYEEWTGPESEPGASTLANLGTLEVDVGHVEEGAQLLQRAYTMTLAFYGPEHSRTAWVGGALARARRTQGRYDEASVLLDRALAIQQRAAPEGEDLPDTRFELAAVYREQRRFAAARQQLEQALAAQEKLFGPAHGKVVETLILLGEVETDSGDVPAARRDLTRAVALAAKIGGEGSLTARAQAALARAGGAITGRR